MELVTVKNKFQIVIPQSIRELAHIGIGDLLEAAIEDGKITFTPKAVIDRDPPADVAPARHRTLERGPQPPLRTDHPERIIGLFAHSPEVVDGILEEVATRPERYADAP